MGYGSVDGDPIVALSEWLRWSSPADGWFLCTESSSFKLCNDYLSQQLKNGKFELFGGHLIELTRQILLSADFDRRLEEITNGQKVPKLRIYGAFLIPEVVPWARDTNLPEVFENFRSQIMRWPVLDAQITKPKYGK